MIDTSGLKPEVIHSVLKREIGEGPDAAAPFEAEANAHLEEKHRVPEGTLRQFISGTRSYLPEPFFSTLAEEVLGFEREDFLRMSEPAISRRPAGQKSTVHVRNPNSDSPFFGKGFRKSPQELLYVKLDEAGTRALSEAVKKRLETSEYSEASMARALNIRTESLNILFREKPSFDHRLQDRFVDMCALLNPSKAKSTDDYLLDLLQEAGPPLTAYPEEMARQLAAINVRARANTKF